MQYLTVLLLSFKSTLSVCSPVASLFDLFLLNSAIAGPTNHLLGAAVVATSLKKAKINLRIKTKMRYNLFFKITPVNEEPLPSCTRRWNKILKCLWVRKKKKTHIVLDERKNT
ncbi:hypothetical protein ATANTOWER_004556 [Ataeniobius toweri]|uniref:Uncharacterized protein n=1 Tax=Ataeniobius toweri TaxID=208326 RepID=A0ABU7BK55_9TELE|nr:hypothetical protein [Ataeniobius toweri]